MKINKIKEMSSPELEKEIEPAFVQDLLKQKEQLLNQKDTIALGKGFANYQALVFVCDLEEEIKPLKEDEYYKIPIIKNIMERL